MGLELIKQIFYFSNKEYGIWKVVTICRLTVDYTSIIVHSVQHNMNGRWKNVLCNKSWPFIYSHSHSCTFELFVVNRALWELHAFVRWPRVPPNYNDSRMKGESWDVVSARRDAWGTWKSYILYHGVNLIEGFTLELAQTNVNWTSVVNSFTLSPLTLLIAANEVR